MEVKLVARYVDDDVGGTWLTVCTVKGRMLDQPATTCFQSAVLPKYA